MDNAKRQAVDLAKQSIEDLKGMVVVGVKEGSKAILYQIAGVIIVIILFGIGRSCNENKNKKKTRQARPGHPGGHRQADRGGSQPGEDRPLWVGGAWHDGARQRPRFVGH